ncbi:MAG: polyisoprenoid-binding protein [Gammaproteobacteria bacterium]|nr:polyisoprenoid-binding protein [Gammaproteobacteria bacterium]
MTKILLALLLSGMTGAALAAPVTYQIDPGHTFPSFETDHFGGLSVWRGRFDHTTGTIVLDKEKGTGTVEVSVDAASVDLGNPKLTEHVKTEQMLDVAKFPTATYKGTLAAFKDGAPTEVHGQFTLHGVTRPLDLTVRTFKCAINPMSKKEVCGADVGGTFNRADYGVSYGEQMGFKMDVKLLIQVEAIRAE